MLILKGIPASRGIAIGPGLLFDHNLSIPVSVQISNPQAELDRLHLALQQAENALNNLYQTTREEVGEESAGIFQAQAMMLSDPELLDNVEAVILNEKINADAAIYQAGENYARIMESLDDEYLSARAADIRDVIRRVVRILQNKNASEVELSQPSIILADDLAPSDTMHFDRALILGFFTAKGGATSHTAILSKGLGIPAVVGSGEIPQALSDLSLMILDGDTGQLILDPDETTLREYQIRQSEQATQLLQDKISAHLPAVTKDGRQVEVVANIGSLNDAKDAVSNGAEGVGLLRTEFSYIEKDAVPDEEELVKTYAEIFAQFGSHPVVVRTLDIGGDKEMRHLNLPVETNPFLGLRGIRLCLARLDLFKPQLRAILRAGVNANLCIMFPMVAVVREVRQAREILNECMAELEQAGLPYQRHPQVGIMIEVPAAVICADQLAKVVDFFSIGTNDLTQYTLAADRTNANVSSLVSPLQPAVLRLVNQLINTAHKSGIWVGMCGEMAGDPIAVPILLGMGLDEFSMNAPAIPTAKEIIRRWDVEDAKQLTQKALLCETPDDVKELVKGWGE